MLALLLALVPASAQACAVALVLAMDVSGSVNREEYALQMQGLADALGDPLVGEALVNAEALVSLVQWSGRTRQTVSIPWTSIESHADVSALRVRVAGVGRAYRNYATAIGEVLGYAADLLETTPHPCDRPVIDVSGDGVSNEGKRPADLHARLAQAGITVNGLAIRGSEPNIVGYYEARVLFGPGAFLEIADGYDDYPRAIRRKLVTELVQRLSGAPGEPMRSGAGLHSDYQQGRRTMAISVGDEVTWSWGNGTGTGTVKQVYTESVTKTIKGSEITRNATDDEPAYLIEQEDGDRVLKSVTEVEAA